MPETVLSSGHAARFCHLCGRRLAGRYYRHSNGIVFCSACHSARPRCARCDSPLDDAMLAKAASLPAGEPRLCGQCLRSTPRCAACHKRITGSWYSFEELLPPDAVRRFCEQCVQKRPRCDICRVPVGANATPLDDGQYRCSLCASEMVLGEAEVRATYEDALAAFRQVTGEALRQTPHMEVVSRLQMGEVRRRYEGRVTVGTGIPNTAGLGVAGHHVLGFYVRSHGGSTIYVERALPRSLLLGTLAHELGHAWQAERAPDVRDALICEGFAEWVAHHVLVERGLRPMAARATRRDDIYGRGLRHMLEIERTGGREAVLRRARGVER
ncbi:MAG: hypothetical protein ACXVDA_23785 [Ktedonobacterales bacterium]